GPGPPDDRPERVIPPGVDGQVRWQRAPVDDPGEILCACEGVAVRARSLLSRGVVLVDAGDRSFEASGLAGALEVEELAEADGEDEDGDDVENEERAIQ